MTRWGLGIGYLADLPETFTLRHLLLSGQHLVEDIGYIEAGMTESPKMIVLCADILIIRSSTRQLPATVLGEIEYIRKRG